MKQYFAYNGKKAVGPYDLQTLKKIKINKDTPIWYTGLPEWTTAEYVEELKSITDEYVQPEFYSHPRNRIAYRMAVVVAILLGTALVYYTINTTKANYTTAKTIQLKAK